METSLDYRTGQVGGVKWLLVVSDTSVRQSRHYLTWSRLSLLGLADGDLLKVSAGKLISFLSHFFLHCLMLFSQLL